MDKLLLKQIIKHEVFLKYALTGAAVTVLEILFLKILKENFGWEVVTASCLAYGFGLVASFFLRKFIAFKDYELKEILKQFGFYTFILIINIGLNAVIIHIWSDWYNLNYLIGQIVSNIFLGFISFVFNRTFTFKNMSIAAMNLPKEIDKIKQEIIEEQKIH